MSMVRTLATEATKKIGDQIKLQGWAASLRDHGGITFLDLRDRSGLIQCVGKDLPKVTAESVIEVVGKVQKRPEKLINPKLATGKVEIEIKKLRILSMAKELPIPVEGDGHEIGEEQRLKYRHLDLRRERLAQNIRLRHRVIQAIREEFVKRDFVEIETPNLTKATPEGARDFLVPSRLQPGEFYALPQSPQQYKQLLMVAGFEKYFQIARCYRDEDVRADRQFEFTQVDVEMSFVEPEEIMQVTEEIVTLITEKIVGKKILKKPFPRFTHDLAIKKFGDDKFDLRQDKKKGELAFAWVTDFPLFERTPEKEITSSHHPFTSPRAEDISLLEKDPLKVRSWQYDLVCNGYEVAGGSIRITDPEIQRKVFKILGHKKEEIEEKFGHLLKAFDYGVPPHGGIAWGLDRLLAVWANEASIREVIAFPQTGGGRTAVMDAPSKVNQEQLKELKLKITS